MPVSESPSKLVPMLFRALYAIVLLSLSSLYAQPAAEISRTEIVRDSARIASAESLAFETACKAEPTFPEKRMYREISPGPESCTGVVICSQAAVLEGIPVRPSWQMAESTSINELAEFGFSGQKSYMKMPNGVVKEVPYGTPGSVRPDLSSEALKLSVDVKNYNITSAQGRYNLVQDIVGQTQSRAVNLPPGMRQGVIIDARGQQISDKLMQRMLDRIVNKSNGLIEADNIFVRLH